MANDNFYGYSNKKPELTLPNGNIDAAFEKINPYEFRKGMDYELTKMGCRNLHSSTPKQRENATTIVLKKLNEMGGYYSNMIAYETEYRGREDKPSFKKFVEGMADHGMKEVDKEFKSDKMEKIKLKEAISKMVKEELRETKSTYNVPPTFPMDDGYTDLDYNKIRAYIATKKGQDFANDFMDTSNKGFYENVIAFLGMNEDPTDEEVFNFVDGEIEKDRTITSDELLNIIKDNRAALDMDPNLGGDMVQLFIKFGDKIPQAEVDNLLRFLEENKTQNPNKMTKEELDKMIKEELDAYLREEDEIEVDVEDDAEGGESEDVLRKIYDMLKDMFEGEAEAEEVEDEMEDEEEEDEEEMDEIEEGKKKDEMEEEMKKKDMEEEMKKDNKLQERFQKLANIVKG